MMDLSNSLTLLLTIIIFFTSAILMGKKLEYLRVLLLVIIIGTFQGIANLLFNVQSELLFLKYGLLFLCYFFFLIKFLLNEPKISYSLKNYILLYIIFIGLFSVMVLNSIDITHKTIDFPNLRLTIANWSLLNIPVVFIIVFGIKKLDTVYKFLKLILVIGIFASAIGVLQYLIRYGNLYNLGLNVKEVPFALLSQGNTIFFRVFSIFPTHYEFASFLVLSMLSQIILQTQKLKKFPISQGIFYILQLIALGLTFNITLWILFILIKLALLLTSKIHNLEGLREAVIKTFIFDLLLFAIIILFIPAIRERFLGIFKSSGIARSSINSRLFISKNTIEYIFKAPFGLGIYTFERINSMGKSLYITTDTYFLWLILQGGIFLFISYLLLFLFPLVLSYKKRNYIEVHNRPLFYTIWLWILIVVVIGGVSNSATLIDTPTNLIVFSGIGLLFRMTASNSASLTYQIQNQP